jgi:putative endopeptidase
VPQAEAAAQAQSVIELETRIAQASRPLVELRDPRRNYARVPVETLGKSYRNLQLAEFLKAQGVSDDVVSIAHPELFAQLNLLVAQLKPAQWKTYLRWRVGDARAPYLSKAWREPHFEFHGRLLGGQRLPVLRQYAVLDAINQAAGPMLAREYIARYLAPNTRERALEVADRVRTTLAASIDSDPRLGPQARAEAKAKLDKLKIEVGAPRRNVDYTVQPMGRGSFGSNMLIASTWHHREEMKRIGRGNADRRWDVLPQQPALAYDVAQNRLIVTAAMLQPPVFDLSQDTAAQYGAFGALVGRELHHALDDKGRFVDARGEMRDWWTPGEAAAWEALASSVAGQYGAYPYPMAGGPMVNGAQVRDVAIADQAGVELAWNAFRSAQPTATKEQQQGFYTAWARLWPQLLTREAATTMAASSVHAPGQWRANAPLVNQPGFAEAFGCKAGSAMQAKAGQRIALWPAGGAPM